MYKKAAGLFANELYDELVNSEILDDENILCNKMLQDSTKENPLRDKNFLLWSLNYVYMRDWCGPYYNTYAGYMLWKVDTEWSGRRMGVNQYENEVAKRVLALYEHEEENLLSQEDYAWLSERG